MILADSHCDTLCKLADCGGTLFDNNFDISLNKIVNIERYSQFFACFISPEHYKSPKKRFLKLKDTYIKNTADIPPNIHPYITIEGGECIESLSDVEEYYNYGVRVIALTWNNDNKIACGADTKNDTGISSYGKAVIGEMNRLGMTVDVSHLSDKSFYDAYNLVKRPLIATHSNSRFVCAHRRNLTDEQFKLICDMGGYVGINSYPPFVSGKNRATVKQLILHIEHFSELGGGNCIGLGLDFDGMDFYTDGLNGISDIDNLIPYINEKTAYKNFENILL